jgi:hypothetical protein
VLVTISPPLWDWIDEKPWLDSEWELLKEPIHSKATKVQRALLLLYRWFKSLPKYLERKGNRVMIEFDNESQAQAFCALLSQEKDKR